MTALLETVGLQRYFGRHCAVNDLSFSVERGEIVGFLGPNGAGKSTTMQMICGVLAPSSGSIRIDGVDLLEAPRVAKSKLGFLPETPPLYRDLTVDETLDFCARLQRIQRTQRRQSITRVKQQCGLEACGKQLIGTLSKGFRQRVGIAQTILHQPALIVLDEPTSGLDPNQISDIRTLIRQLSAADHAILLSTHTLSEVQQLCSSVQILHHGQLLYHGPTDQLEQHASGSMLLVTRNAPDRSRIEAVHSVRSVESLQPTRLRIQYHPATNPAEEISALVVKAGWGLLELTPEKESLERFFADLTNHKPPSHRTASDTE